MIQYHRHVRAWRTLSQTVQDIAEGKEYFAYCEICNCVPTKMIGQRDVEEKIMENQEAGAAERTAEARTTLDDLTILQRVTRAVCTGDKSCCMECGAKVDQARRAIDVLLTLEFDFEAHRDTTYRCTIHGPQNILVVPVDSIKREGPFFGSTAGIVYPLHRDTEN